MDICTILTKLNGANGPSGGEAPVAREIAALARPYVDEITTDTLGNLICRKKGSGPKVMLAAHMDSLGLMVTHIEKEGFLRVAKVGGVHPEDILHTPVRFPCGAVGTVCADGSAEAGKLTMEDLYLDMGFASREEAEGVVQVGDVAVYHLPVYQTAGRILSPYMDNRISCAVLLLAMEQLRETTNDVYFVFTVQEEVGLRGARTAAWAIDPDYAVAVDVCGCRDVPGSKTVSSSRQGGGAAIKVMDASVISHPAMVELLRRLAREGDIPFQMDVLGRGGTDAGAIHQSRAGVVTGGISVPCRYIHSPGEMVTVSDVEACVRLSAALAQAKLD